MTPVSTATSVSLVSSILRTSMQRELTMPLSLVCCSGEFSDDFSKKKLVDSSASSQASLNLTSL